MTTYCIHVQVYISCHLNRTLTLRGWLLEKRGQLFSMGREEGRRLQFLRKEGVGWEVAIFVKKIKLKSEIFNDKKSL